MLWNTEGEGWIHMLIMLCPCCVTLSGLAEDGATYQKTRIALRLNEVN